MVIKRYPVKNAPIAWHACVRTRPLAAHSWAAQAGLRPSRAEHAGCVCDGARVCACVPCAVRPKVRSRHNNLRIQHVSRTESHHHQAACIRISHASRSLRFGVHAIGAAMVFKC